jgi:hypothetical protein
MKLGSTLIGDSRQAELNEGHKTARVAFENRMRIPEIEWTALRFETCAQRDECCQWGRCNENQTALATQLEESAGVARELN